MFLIDVEVDLVLNLKKTVQVQSSVLLKLLLNVTMEHAEKHKRNVNMLVKLFVRNHLLSTVLVEVVLLQ